MNDQHGYAGRDQYNIAGNAYFHGDDSYPSEAGTASGENTTNGVGGFLLIAGIILLAIWGISASGTSLPTVRFPSRSNPWPAGATRSLILSPVMTRLRTCSHAPVLAPDNCPQSISDDTDVPAPAPWALYDDPADGAKIVYWKDQFYIAGNAVMKATYSSDSSDSIAVQIVHYRATVHWLNDTATLATIKSVSASSGPVITKHEPKIPWSQLQQAVLSAFVKCAGSESVPLPPQCPTNENSDITGSNARWHLTANPVLNAAESFDRSSGLIHVIGSYAMSASYHLFLFGVQHDPEAGNYDATIAIDGSKVVVLQIANSK